MEEKSPFTKTKVIIFLRHERGLIFFSVNNFSAQEHASSKNRHIFNFKVMLCVTLSCERVCPEGGGGVTPYNGLYGEAPPERGTSFSL